MYTTPKEPQRDAMTLGVVRFKSFPDNAESSPATFDEALAELLPSPPPRIMSGGEEKTSPHGCSKATLPNVFVERNNDEGNAFRRHADEVASGGTWAPHEKPLTILLRSATPIKLCILCPAISTLVATTRTIYLIWLRVAAGRRGQHVRRIFSSCVGVASSWRKCKYEKGGGKEIGTMDRRSIAGQTLYPTASARHRVVVVYG